MSTNLVARENIEHGEGKGKGVIPSKGIGWFDQAQYCHHMSWIYFGSALSLSCLSQLLPCQQQLLLMSGFRFCRWRLQYDRSGGVGVTH